MVRATHFIVVALFCALNTACGSSTECVQKAKELEILKAVNVDAIESCSAHSAVPILSAQMYFQLDIVEAEARRLRSNAAPALAEAERPPYILVDGLRSFAGDINAKGNLFSAYVHESRDEVYIYMDK